jgi:HD-GYP domain-containing protein (c-di-GMP phosphodiesterase class II)
MISLDNVKPGAILGKAIWGDEGYVLLKEDAVLTSRYIQRLKKIGIAKCYIKDEISEGIVLPKRLDDKLRIEAIEIVSGLYNGVLENRHTPVKTWKRIEQLIDNILDEMLGEDELVCDMMDLKTYDNYTFSHCVNVALLSTVTGTAMGLDRTMLYHLAVGGLMHDVGKMFIPIELVNKDQSLTSEEFELMKTHPEKGYQYLLDAGQTNENACEGVLHHHERVDGLGYPNGIYGRSINRFGKIYAICDVYDAITSDRPYRKAWNVNEGLEYIMANGNIRFDALVVKDFLNNIMPYPVGTIVKLSNGFKAIIIKNNKKIVNRPTIRIFEEGGQMVKPYIVYLMSDRDFLNVTIVETVEG